MTFFNLLFDLYWYIKCAFILRKLYFPQAGMGREPTTASRHDVHVWMKHLNHTELAESERVHWDYVNLGI